MEKAIEELSVASNVHANKITEFINAQIQVNDISEWKKANLKVQVGDVFENNGMEGQKGSGVCGRPARFYQVYSINNKNTIEVEEIDAVHRPSKPILNKSIGNRQSKRFDGDTIPALDAVKINPLTRF